MHMQKPDFYKQRCMFILPVSDHYHFSYFSHHKKETLETLSRPLQNAHRMRLVSSMIESIRRGKIKLYTPPEYTLDSQKVL